MEICDITLMGFSVCAIVITPIALFVLLLLAGLLLNLILKLILKIMGGPKSSSAGRPSKADFLNDDQEREVAYREWLADRNRDKNSD